MQEHGTVICSAWWGLTADRITVVEQMQERPQAGQRWWRHLHLLWNPHSHGSWYILGDQHLSLPWWVCFPRTRTGCSEYPHKLESCRKVYKRRQRFSPVEGWFLWLWTQERTWGSWSYYKHSLFVPVQDLHHGAADTKHEAHTQGIR